MRLDRNRRKTSVLIEPEQKLGQIMNIHLTHRVDCQIDWDWVIGSDKVIRGSLRQIYSAILIDFFTERHTSCICKYF